MVLEKATGKVALLTTLIIGKDDADAAAKAEHLIAGADLQALFNTGMAMSGETREHKINRGAERLTDSRKVFFGLPLIGGPATLAEQLVALSNGGVDSLCLIFPDYADGLDRLPEVMALMRRSVTLGRAD